MSVSSGSVGFTWDANGNMVSRSEGGETETFDWDVEQRLVSVDGPDGESSFVYDVDGSRLLRTTDEGSTLYSRCRAHHRIHTRRTLTVEPAGDHDHEPAGHEPAGEPDDTS